MEKKVDAITCKICRGRGDRTCAHCSGKGYYVLKDKKEYEHNKIHSFTVEGNKHSWSIEYICSRDQIYAMAEDGVSPVLLVNKVKDDEFIRPRIFIQDIFNFQFKSAWLNLKDVTVNFLRYRGGGGVN